MFRIRQYPHPVRDWFLVLAVAAILLGASFGWAAWTYYQAALVTMEKQTTTATPVLDTANVDAITTLFEKRKAEAEQYSSTYQFVDPSR